MARLKPCPDTKLIFRLGVRIASEEQIPQG